MAETGRQVHGGGKASSVRFSQHLDLDAQLEVLQLKEKLQKMTVMVRQLLQHMDQLERIHPLFSTEPPQHKDSVATQTTPLVEEKLDLPLQQEMAPTLKSKMKELVDMNLNWQKYNALQEKHVQELHNKVEQMQQKLTTAEDNSQRLNQQLQEENNRLKAMMEKLRLQNDVLQAAVEVKGKASGEMERAQLLEAQLMVYREDFLTERKDRETAQARVVQLEMELLELTKQMRQTTSTGFPNRAPHYTVDSDLQTDGEDHHRVTTEDLATDCVDGPSWQMVLPPESRKEKVDAGKLSRSYIDKKLPLRTKEDTLCCTKCFKVFPQSKHLELLEHLEECDRR